MLLGVSDAICLQLRSFTRVCLGIRTPVRDLRLSSTIITIYFCRSGRYEAFCVAASATSLVMLKSPTSRRPIGNRMLSSLRSVLRSNAAARQNEEIFSLIP